MGFGAKPWRLEYIDEFACEQLLNVAFMNEAYALLGSQLLAVAIPVRGILVAAKGAEQPQVGNLVSYARRAFVGAPDGMEPITPHALIVRDGQPVGALMSDGATEPHHIEPARGFPWPVQAADAAATPSN